MQAEASALQRAPEVTSQTRILPLKSTSKDSFRFFCLIHKSCGDGESAAARRPLASARPIDSDWTADGAVYAAMLTVV